LPIPHTQDLLAKKGRVLEMVKSEATAIAEKHGDARRTTVHPN
jgi:DNA gyrase/topoisomerase IV subunit A